MKKIIAPQSVVKKVRRKYAFLLLKLAALLGVAWIVVDAVLAEMMERTNIGVWTTTVVVIMAVPFIICGVPKKFFDRSYYGKILSIEVGPASEGDIKKDERRAKAESIQHALVEDERGKLHTVEIFDEGQMFPGREKRYFVGDRVVHIYGTEYLCPFMPKSFDRKKVCVWCGEKHDGDATECRYCGCSLDIKVLDEKGESVI